MVNHGFELGVVDVRQRQIEDVAGAGRDGGEEAVEEDGVQNRLDDVADRSGVGEDVEDELWRRLLVHGRGGAGEGEGERRRLGPAGGQALKRRCRV